jgi:hypothetical protein
MIMARTQVAKTRVAKGKAPRFRYSDVPAADLKKCEDAVERIHGYQRRMASDVVAIGCLLLDVKEKLEHGQFTAWIKHYFGWSQQTASNMMRAGAMFGKLSNFCDLTIETSAVYLLASMTCPDDLREDILAMASKGERITHATVREAIDELRRDDDADGEEQEEPAQQTEAKLIKWSLASFAISARRLVVDWRDLCPDEERSEMAQVLRYLAEQIEQHARESFKYLIDRKDWCRNQHVEMRRSRNASRWRREMADFENVALSKIMEHDNE